jgi:hypothetical protein
MADNRSAVRLPGSEWKQASRIADLRPIGIGGTAYFTGLAPALPALLGLFSLLGDLSIIYSIAKAGLYRPLPV